MNNNATRSLFFALWALVFALGSGSAAATLLSLQPSSQTAMPGNMVSLDLVIGGLDAGGPDSLGDFDINIGFDPGALSLVGFGLGPYLGDVGLGEAADFSLGDLGGGTVNVAEVSLLFPFELDALQPDSFTLATFNFMVDVLPPGSSTSVMIDTVFALGDGFGLPLQLDGTAGAVIRNPGVDVPEPAVLGLVALGLAGIRLSRRRTMR